MKTLNRDSLTLSIPLALLFLFCHTTSLAATTERKIAEAEMFFAVAYQDTTPFTELSMPFMNVAHGAVNWGDFDNDGDLDLLLTGIGGRTDSIPDTNNLHYSIVYRNDDTTFTDIGASLIGVNSSDGAFWADFDRDGDLDLFLSGLASDNTNIPPVSKIYRNDGGTFVDMNIPIPGLIGTAAWGDYDNDGDLDLIISGSPDLGASFQTILMRNDDSTFTSVPTGIPGAWGSSLDWGDYDGDGDLDLLLVGYGGGVRAELWRNDGGTFVQVPVNIQPVSSGAARWGDYDNDGRPDILLAGLAPGGVGGYTTIYHNDGGGSFTNIHPALAAVGGPNIQQAMEIMKHQIPSAAASMSGVGVAAVAWVDYDNDGDLDAAISGMMPNNVPITAIYRNDGGVFTDINAGLEGVWFSALSFGDYDHDGDLDLVVSGFSKVSFSDSYPYGYYPWGPIARLYRNNLAKINTKPEAPLNLSAVHSGNDVTFTWDVSTDQETPQSALTYNIRLSSTSGGENRIVSMSNLANGYRRVARAGNMNRKTSFKISGLSQGTYYWSVQAVDNSFAGSPFSAEQTLDITPPPVWHMISIPYTHAGYNKTDLFPTAVSAAFRYDPALGYKAEDVLATGSGYWLKFAFNDLPQISSGGSLPSISIPVIKGWNLIGSISAPIAASSITSNPPGIITSQFFGYNGAYYSESTVVPGNAYWIKVNQDGNLLLSSSGSIDAASRIVIIPSAELPPPPPTGDIISEVLPPDFSISQNYPNPFNPATTIRFTLATDAFVTVRVYNILGQEVALLADHDKFRAGSNELKFDGSALSSGLYYYRITAQDRERGQIVFSSVRKMVLIK